MLQGSRLTPISREEPWARFRFGRGVTNSVAKVEHGPGPIATERKHVAVRDRRRTGNLVRFDDSIRAKSSPSGYRVQQESRFGFRLPSERTVVRLSDGPGWFKIRSEDAETLGERYRHAFGRQALIAAQPAGRFDREPRHRSQSRRLIAGFPARVRLCMRTKSHNLGRRLPEAPNDPARSK